MHSHPRPAPHCIPAPKPRARVQWAAGGAIALLFGLASPLLQAGERSGESEAQKETGVATYYAPRFEGRRTASGQTFRHSELLAAHAFHPFGTLVRVTNLRNGTFVDVKIADRGGFAKRSSDLIIDLSRSAAARLDMLAGGRARVLVEVLARRGEKAPVAAETASRAPEAPQIAADGD